MSCLDSPEHRDPGRGRIARCVLRALLPLVLLAVTVGARTPARAGPLGPLEGVIEQGRSGAWTVSLDAGGLVLENRENPNSIRYYYVGPGPREAGSRRIEATLSIAPEGEAGAAGLLYGFVAEPLFYYAFVRTAGGRVALLRREPDGLQELMSTDVGEAGERLAIVERGREIDLEVDGRNIGSIEGRGTGAGAAGIVAWGLGRFTFRNFAVREIATEGTAPASPGSAPLPREQSPSAPPAPTAAGPSPPPGPQPAPGAEGPPTAPAGAPAEEGTQPPGAAPLPPLPQWGPPPAPPPGWGQPPQGYPPAPPPGWGQPPQGYPPAPPPGWGQPPQGYPPAPPPGWGQPPPTPGQPVPVQPVPGQETGPPPAPPPVTGGDRTAEAGIARILDTLRQLSRQAATTGGVQIPAPPEGFEQYIDPSVDLVVVNHPRGWRVSAIARQAPFAPIVEFADVRISSPDGLHLVHARRQTFGRPVTAPGLARELLAELEAGLGPADILLEDQWAVRTRGALTSTRLAFVGGRLGGHAVAILASTTGLTGYGTSMTFAGSAVVVGPAAQFSEMADRVYVPILVSMSGW